MSFKFYNCYILHLSTKYIDDTLITTLDSTAPQQQTTHVICGEAHTSSHHTTLPRIEITLQQRGIKINHIDEITIYPDSLSIYLVSKNATSESVGYNMCNSKDATTQPSSQLLSTYQCLCCTSGMIGLY